MKKYFFILIFLITTLQNSFLKAQKDPVDSLEHLLLSENIDTNRCALLDKLFWLCRHQQTEKALRYAKEYCKETEKFNLTTANANRLAYIKASSMLNYAIALSEVGQFDQAIEEAKLALEVANKFDSKKQIAICFNNIGEFYRMKADYKMAIEYYLKSLKIKEDAGDKKGMGFTYHNLGNTFASMNRNKEAIENYEKAISLREEVGHKKGMADSYSNMGAIFIVLGQDEKALSLYQKSIALQREMVDSTGVANDLNNFGSYYEKKQDYKLALNYYLQAQAIYINSQDDYMLGYAKIAIASAYAMLGKQKEAIDYSNEAINLGRKLNMKRELQDWYNVLSGILSEFKDYKGALDAKNLSVRYNDSIINESSNQSISNMKVFYESEKQDQKIKTQSAEIQMRQEEVKRQQVQKISLIGAMLLMLVFGVFVYRSYRQKKQANVLLAIQNAEINEKKNIIEEKHKEITDSINYAERIQRSFLATEDLLNENLKDHFVFFQPKDIVSGDFYWASKLSNNNFALVTADSTGHGVPGAIMSLLNVTSLESAIKDGFTEPCDILNATRKTIIDRLKKDGSIEGGKDGMDASLISFDFLNNKFVYSAANNPVWVVRKNELIELKADKMPIGKHNKDNEPFTQSEFGLQKDDVVYTLTDGFSDQFGGPKGKKFMYKKLKDLLISIAQLPMNEQQDVLRTSLNTWKGNLEQVDDVCVIGVRI